MKKRMKIKPVWIVLAVLLLVGVTGAVSAKYISALQGNDGTFTAPTFYFRSTLMTEEAEPAPVAVNGKQASIPLSNAASSTEFSDTDIKYTLTYFILKDGNWLSVNTEEDNILTGGVCSAEMLALTPINFGGVTYDTVMLEARATAPFEKVLRVCVDFQYEAYTVVYGYDTVTKTVTATLQTNADEGTFNISWVEGVSPDNADENGILNEALVGPSSVSPVLPDYHTYLFKFFVTDPTLDAGITAAADLQTYLAAKIPISFAP